MFQNEVFNAENVWGNGVVGMGGGAWSGGGQ